MTPTDSLTKHLDSSNYTHCEKGYCQQLTAPGKAIVINRQPDGKSASSERASSYPHNQNQLSNPYFHAHHHFNCGFGYCHFPTANNNISQEFALSSIR